MMNNKIQKDYTCTLFCMFVYYKSNNVKLQHTNKYHIIMHFFAKKNNKQKICHLLFIFSLFIIIKISLIRQGNHDNQNSLLVVVQVQIHLLKICNL